MPPTVGLPHMSSTGKLTPATTTLNFSPGLFGHPQPPKPLSLPPPTVTTAGSHVDTIAPPMFHPQALPPPPGLLQILMSAEKCQVNSD